MVKTKKSAARKKPDPSAGPTAAQVDAGSVGATAPGETGLSFEGALEQLEETVGRLEEGEMPLEEALALFEQGVQLSRQCTATLEAAEKRVEILVAGRGDDWLVAPFEPEIDSGVEEDDEDVDFD